MNTANRIRARGQTYLYFSIPLVGLGAHSPVWMGGIFDASARGCCDTGFILSIRFNTMRLYGRLVKRR